MSNISGQKRGQTYPSRRAGPVLFDTALYATEFGADPTGVDDSTAALNAFLLATGEQNRRGRIPAGTYLISGTLYTHNTDTSAYFNGGIIEGDGRGVTKIKWAGAKDDGSAMMVWSRQNGTLRDLSFDGDYKATYGLAVQNAQNGVISVTAEYTWQHGIVVANAWPSAGLINGFNEACVIDRPRVDFCGKTEIQLVRLYGTGLGGTFTLTFDGNTTAGIAWNASAATVAAALLAANPGLAGPTAANGGTGNNPFVVSGTLDTTMNVTLKGLAAGHHATMILDTAGITGTILNQQTALVQEGSVANGIHFFDKDDPEANNDNGTMAIFEPACRQNSGSGLSLAGASIKIWGGHFEGNVVYGLHLKSFQPSVNGYSVSNMVHWPYFEGNYVAGAYANYATRDWWTVAADVQQMVAANGGDAVLQPGPAAEGGYGVVLRGTAGYKLHLGSGADGVIWQETQADARTPVRITAMYDDLSYIALNANGPLTFDAGRHNTYTVQFNADATSVAITNSKSGQIYTFSFIRGAAPHTVAWPAAIKWAGGAAPVLGTGAANSIDIIVLQQQSGVFYEVSRSLAVA